MKNTRLKLFITVITLFIFSSLKPGNIKYIGKIPVQLEILAVALDKHFDATDKTFLEAKTLADVKKELTSSEQRQQHHKIVYLIAGLKLLIKHPPGSIAAQ